LTRTQELLDKAAHFAARALHAKSRTERNTCLSLEQSYRNLAAHNERFDAARRELEAVAGEAKTAASA